MREIQILLGALASSGIMLSAILVSSSLADTNSQAAVSSVYIKNGLLELPNNTFIRPQQVLCAVNKPGSLMGDGFSAVIVTADKGEVDSYIKSAVMAGKGWRKGPAIEHEKDLIDFLKGAMNGLEAAKHIQSKIDLEVLVYSPHTYFWSEKHFNATGYVSNGLLWIIDPQKNMIIMLNEDT